MNKRERIFHDIYEPIEKVDSEVLWKGDLIALPNEVGSNALHVYMLYLNPQTRGLGLICFVGEKAGSVLDIDGFPPEASIPGATNVRLDWLRRNWKEAVPIGTFRSARFYRWKQTFPIGD